MGNTNNTNVQTTRRTIEKSTYIDVYKKGDPMKEKIHSLSRDQVCSLNGQCIDTSCMYNNFGTGEYDHFDCSKYNSYMNNVFGLHNKISTTDDPKLMGQKRQEAMIEKTTILTVSEHPRYNYPSGGMNIEDVFVRHQLCDFSGSCTTTSSYHNHMNRDGSIPDGKPVKVTDYYGYRNDLFGENNK